MKRIFSVFIGIVLLFSVLLTCACGEKAEKINDGLSVKTMTDFESVQEIMSLKVTASESKLALNKEDKQYITSGEGSLKMTFNAKMTAIGYYEDNIVQFIPQQKYFEITDFANVVGFAADIWNENDYEVETCLSFNNRVTVIGYRTLQKGYNSVIFTFDNNQVYAFAKREIQTVDLSFYSGRGNDVLYMDNVRLISSEKEYVPYDYKAAFSKDLNYSFDTEAETYPIIDLGGYDSIFSRARVSVNRDKRFVKLGEGSLKVDFKTSPKTGKIDNNVIRTYDNMTGDFNAYVGKGYYLKADVFNPCDKDVVIEFKVFSTIDDETYAIAVNIKAGSWSDGNLKIAVDDIKNAFTNDRVSVLTVVFGFYGLDGGDSVYIDNIRFEKESV